MIPEFEPGGNLPAGIHPAKWAEFVARFGTTDHRRRLAAGLKRALDSLKRAGCVTAYIDGSYVTSKEHPDDFDACWDPVGVDPRLPHPALLRFEDGRRLQKIAFLGELFPATIVEGDSGRRFVEFFQVDNHTGDPKGIVSLAVQELP